MFDTYRAVFRTPGTAAFCAAGFVMRMPIAMYPIGLVLIVSARTGHYGFAGVLSAVYVIANGVGNPTLARMTDRFGQRRLLIAATVVHVVATVVLAQCIIARTPDAVLVVPAAVSGFAELSAGSLMRARWSFVLGQRPELATAYSLESALDEVLFVVGPLVATVIATNLPPVVVLYVAVSLVAVGATALSALRASEPPVHAPGEHPGSAIRVPGMPLLCLVAVAMGMVFASAEVTIVAFCGQHGHRGLSGAVLAAIALGSATAGFAYGARRWRADLLDRFRWQAVLFGLLPLLFLAAVDIGVLAACAFVVGLGIAPTLITAFGLIERIVPAASLTEGLAWLITGLSVGYGAGASVVGRLADAYGARSAFLVTIAAGLLTTVLALVLHARLAPRRAPEPVGVGAGWDD